MPHSEICFVGCDAV